LQICFQHFHESVTVNNDAAEKEDEESGERMRTKRRIKKSIGRRIRR
jgi:hypothetical protein